MGITYTIDEVRGVVLEVWSSTVTLREAGEHWTHMLDDPGAFACGRSLVDVREARFDFKGTELALTVKNVLLPRLGARKWKTAAFVGAPVQFGVARQFAVFAESSIAMEVFNDRDAALAWLTAP